jgi:hypothetical protein
MKEPPAKCSDCGVTEQEAELDECPYCNELFCFWCLDGHIEWEKRYEARLEDCEQR